MGEEILVDLAILEIESVDFDTLLIRLLLKRHGVWRYKFWIDDALELFRIHIAQNEVSSPLFPPYTRLACTVS